MIAGMIIIVTFLLGLFVALWCFFFKKMKVPIHDKGGNLILLNGDEESESYSISNSESGSSYCDITSSKLQTEKDKSKN